MLQFLTVLLDSRCCAAYEGSFAGSPNRTAPLSAVQSRAETLTMYYGSH